MPELTSIIMVTFNELERATRPCIESIYKFSPAGEFELLVVDNNSTDGTRDYLVQMAAEKQNLHYLPQTENLGFAAGNNIGLRAAKGEYLVMLNNDTLVTPDWLGQLRQPLAENKRLGMVGPISNSTGNEQRVLLAGIDEHNYLELASAYTSRQKGSHFNTTMLGFFCIALHRRVLKKVGYLDEAFGLGMFEDDDFCLRVRKAGFDLAVLEDCFIYHLGSLSFNRLPRSTYRELAERNKQYFFGKHKTPWNLTDHAFSYWHKVDGDLQEYAQDQDDLDPRLERIQVRWFYFKHLLAQIQAAELRNNGFPLAAASREARETLWQIRWQIFNQQFVKGSWREKFKFLIAVKDWLFRRQTN